MVIPLDKQQMNFKPTSTIVRGRKFVSDMNSRISAKWNTVHGDTVLRLDAKFNGSKNSIVFQLPQATVGLSARRPLAPLFFWVKSNMKTFDGFSFRFEMDFLDRLLFSPTHASFYRQRMQLCSNNWPASYF